METVLYPLEPDQVETIIAALEDRIDLMEAAAAKAPNKADYLHYQSKAREAEDLKELFQ